MKVWRKVRNILALAMLFAVLHATAVLAETTVSITGGENLQVGGPVAVTVTLQSDTAMEESDLFISYDSALMQFVSGDDAEVQSDGRIRIRWAYDDPATQKIWTLQFNAVAAGSGTVSAADVWVRDTDGNTASGVTVNDGTVSISEAGQTAAGDQDAAAASAEPAAAGQDSELAALAEQIANDGTMSCLIGTEKWIVTEEFGNDILLPHFVETTRFYKGVEVTAGKLNNAEYYILLVHSEDGSQEKFARYDQETKTFSDIIRLEQGEDCALFMIDPSEEAIPDAFTETTYEGYRAWQLSDAAESDGLSADPSEFYLFYGYDQDGTEGWFLFDSVTGGFTRYVETAPAAAADADTPAVTETDGSLTAKYNSLLSRFEFMVTCIKYVAIALIALLLILLIVNLTDKGKEDDVKKKNKQKKKQAKKQAKRAEQADREPEQIKAPVKEKAAAADSAAKTAAPAVKAADSATKAAPAVKAADSATKAAPAVKAADSATKAAPAVKAADSATKAADSAAKTAAPAAKADALQETKKIDKVKPAAQAAAKKAQSSAVKADADGFIDDYIEKEDQAAPQNAQEEKEIGVLKPVAKKTEDGKETDKSMHDSIEELSRQIQDTIKEEKQSVDVSALEDLTFIDLD